jgi:adenine-specific DNA-methyltransferase
MVKKCWQHASGTLGGHRNGQRPICEKQSGVEGVTNARLELTWPNKDKFLLAPKDENGKPVWVERDHPAAHEVRLTDFTASFGTVDDSDPFSDNLLFTGDSLDVLRVLNEVPEFRRLYRGRVKLVYIDPPFNTGQTFAHYDDWMEHSTWLSFMRDRLLLIRDLLAPDGSVWVHLDNFEVHRMRCLMDEIFGAEQFLNTIVWKRTTAKSSAVRSLGTMYDSLLGYAKSDATKVNRVLLPYSDEYLAGDYKYEDAKGRYRISDLTAPGTRNGDSGEIWRGIDPSAKRRHWVAPQTEKLLSPEQQLLPTRAKLDALDELGYIFWRPTAGSVPLFKRYLDPNGGVALGDIWLDMPTPNPRDQERNGYSTQKPEAMVARLIEVATNPGDVVLDAFGGSGTTAAVAHKMGRRWITAEILRDTVEHFTQPRLEKVIGGGDRGGISDSVGWSGGGGFRAVEVAPTMYEITPFGLLLADWAEDSMRFARTVAGQLGFVFESDTAPFCGRRGRMRLAVLDTVGVEEARQLVAALGETERVTVVAKRILPGVEQLIAESSRGSRVRKAPRDLLADRTNTRNRRTEGTD